MITRLVKLYRDSGFFLFILRMPIRAVKRLLDLTSTQFYSLVLGQFQGGIIEWGVRIENPKNVFIGKNVYISNGTKIISESSEGRLVIGDFVQIGLNCHIDHTGNIEIGNFCHISEQVFIFSHSHGHNPRSKPVPIDKQIGSETWIGVRAIILESAGYIASNTLIASASLVAKSVSEPSQVIGGVPAKFIKARYE